MTRFKSFVPILIFMIVTAFLLKEKNLKGKVVCFGDSITYGAYVEGNGWVEQINEKSKDLKFVNEGRKGRKTSDKNELLPVLENNKDADYVLFLLGVNDLKNGTDSMVASCVENMKWMIDKVKEEIPNAKIVLMAPCSLNLRDMSDLNKKKLYNENTEKSLVQLVNDYKELAKKESIGFIDLFSTVSMNNYIDGLHPNVDGYKQMADEIWTRLNDIFNYH